MVIVQDATYSQVHWLYTQQFAMANPSAQHMIYIGHTERDSISHSGDMKGKNHQIYNIVRDMRMVAIWLNGTNAAYRTCIWMIHEWSKCLRLFLDFIRKSLVLFVSFLFAKSRMCIKYYQNLHYSGITWAAWPLKSWVTGMRVQQFV